MVDLGDQREGRFDAFYALETDKRQRLINAALAEFAEKGFKQASTNKIAAKAQIGKGMLFYYFGSKEELFDFLCEYSIEFVGREIVDKLIAETGDFIERQKLLAAAKKQAITKQPLMFALFESFYRPENAAYVAKHADTLAHYRAEFYSKLYDGVDYSLFRPDVLPQNAVRYITWLIDGYRMEVEQKIVSGSLESDAWTLYDEFIDDLKKLFYKEEA